MKQPVFQWDYFSEVPEHTREALENYFIHGYQPGGFLTSVLANDLVGAVSRADSTNKRRIPEIVNWVVFNAPAGSWGSLEVVDSWCEGNEHREAFQKQLMLKVLAS
jgi:hypothetical protein